MNHRRNPALTELGVIMLAPIDKLTEQYTIRVPAILKKQIDQLPMQHKRRLTEAILVAMAKVCHEAAFDPTVYLNEEKFKANDASQSKKPSFLSLEEEDPE